jgi:hypothetical protein
VQAKSSAYPVRKIGQLPTTLVTVPTSRNERPIDSAQTDVGYGRRLGARPRSVAMCGRLAVRIPEPGVLGKEILVIVKTTREA